MILIILTNQFVFLSHVVINCRQAPAPAATHTKDNSCRNVVVKTMLKLNPPIPQYFVSRQIEYIISKISLKHEINTVIQWY